MKLENKTILITGASSGIGYEVAKQLVEKNNRLIVIARRKNRLEELLSICKPHDDGHLFFVADVSELKNVQKIYDDLVAKGIHIDMLLLNAGIGKGFYVNNIDIDDFHKTFNVNLFSAVYFCKLFLPEMIKNQQGIVAVVSSLSGYRGTPGAAPYSSSKAALSNFIQSIRIDTAKSGIYCAEINPGFVKSEITDKNDYEMPFLMETDAAAKRIINGLEKGKLEIHFPYRLSLLLKFMRILPHSVYTWISQQLR